MITPQPLTHITGDMADDADNLNTPCKNNKTETLICSSERQVPQNRTLMEFKKCALVWWSKGLEPACCLHNITCTSPSLPTFPGNSLVLLPIYETPIETLHNGKP